MLMIAWQSKTVLSWFPVWLAFIMTVNKSQSQVFNKIGLYIDQNKLDKIGLYINQNKPIFGHGQL